MDASRLAIVVGPVVVNPDRPAHEPGLVQHPSGALIAVGFSNAQSDAQERGLDGHPLLAPLAWRSMDHGVTWTQVTTRDVGETVMADSDPDLAVAPDGTLYYATQTFTPQMAAKQIVVGTSRDAGVSWDWTPPLDAAPLAARPWVEVAPDGTAHVVWSQPAGPFHASSSDGGTTWTRTPARIHDGAFAGPGDLAISPDGALAVRVQPKCCALPLAATQDGNDGVSVSHDGGASWTYHPLPGLRDWPDPPTEGGGRDDTWRAFDPLAYDAAGTLYAAWAEDHDIVIASSHDDAQTWTQDVRIPMEDRRPELPRLDALDTGRLIVAYHSEWTEEGLSAVVAHVELRTQKPIVSTITLRDDLGSTSGEYFVAQALADGTIGVVLGDRPAGDRLHYYQLALRPEGGSP